MKRLRLSIVALLTLMGVVTWLLPSLVLFSAADPVLIIEKPDSIEQGYIVDAINAANEQVNIALKVAESNQDNIELIDKQVNKNTGDIKITFKASLYKPFTQKTKEKVMDAMLTEINNSKMSFTNRTRLYNFIAESDVSVSSLVRQLSDDVNADFYAGYKVFQPWSGPIGTLLGVISLVIFVLLSLTIICDLAYMTIPLWQVFANDHLAEKGKKPKTVSLEAFKAVQAAENDNEGKKEVVSIYFHQKSKQMIAISVCLLYLVSGQIYTLFANIVDYFQGIVNTVS